MKVKDFNPWLLAIVGSFLAYLPAVLAFFVKDDIALLHTAEFVPGVFQRSWPGGFYRPFAELLFALEHSLFQMNSVPYHIVSYVAHVVTSYAVLKLARLVLDDVPASRNIAALIFLCHPVNTETVSWISGQMSLMGTLCSVVLLLRLWSSNFEPSRTQTAAVALLFVIGCGFYENFVLVAGMAGIFHFLCDKDANRLKSRLNKPAFIVWITASGLYLLWRFYFLDFGTGYLQLVFSLEGGATNLLYYMYLLLGGTSIGGRIVRYKPETLFEVDNLFHVLPPLLLANVVILLAAITLRLSENRARTPLDSRSDGMMRALLLSATWIAISLIPVFLMSERPRRLAYLAVPGFAFFMTAAIRYVVQTARLNTRFNNTLIGSYLIIALLSLYMRNRDWYYVGSLEKSIPSSVSVEGCTKVIFDMPNLVGDAVFFNSISTMYSLGKLHDREVDVHLQSIFASETDSFIEGCTYRFTNGELEFLAPDAQRRLPVFTRGHNWITLPGIFNKR